MRKASIAILLAVLGSLVSAACAEADNSSAWSGYMWKSTDLTSTTFTTVVGEFFVPAITCPNTGLGPAAGVSIWVGMDAGGTEPLEQVGVDVACDNTQIRRNPAMKPFGGCTFPGRQVLQLTFSL